MEKPLQDLISKHFRDQESRLPDIAFEDCFPVADPAPLLWTGRVFAAAIAASLLVAVLVAGNGLLSRAEQNVDHGLAANMSRDLEQNAGLNLDADQAAEIDHLLARYFSAGSVPLADSIEKVRGDFFRTVILDTRVALKPEQARVAAGLMSTWEPRIENGVITEYEWSQDLPMEQFLAGCSAYCHQGTPAAEIQDYLEDCVMKGFAIPCSPVQRGLPDAIPF